MDKAARELEIEGEAPAESPLPGRSRLFLLQAIPLVVLVLFATACGSSGDLGGSSVGDFFTSRRTDVYLRGFVDAAVIANSNGPPPVITAWAPGLNGNFNTNVSLYAQIFYDEVAAALVIANGISARLENIQVKFTEVDGSDLRDYSVAPPITIAGAYDFQLRPNIAMVASKITSVGGPLIEPGGTATNFFIPINPFSTNIFRFQVEQPTANVRPLLARFTFTGRDILDNQFSLVGYLLMNTILRQKGSSSGG
ncbi:MAG: hypothetical protein HY815_19640 [Candidatus Riflebacteria bacterium]|nr:hypothetical protein [Candidatus Riflebacteria bacterium]